MSEVLTVAQYRLALAQLAKKPSRKNKYGAKPQVVDGHRFPSILEATRYGGLKLLQRAGTIRALRIQVPFELMAAGEKVGVYIVDFAYEELLRSGIWQPVVEDTKGFATPVYKLKAAWFRRLYPQFDFREIK